MKTKRIPAARLWATSTPVSVAEEHLLDSLSDDAIAIINSLVQGGWSVADSKGEYRVPA